MLRNLEQDDGSLAWSFNTYLSPPVEIVQSQFGYSVASNGGVVAISAPFADGKGSIHLYDCSIDDQDFPTFPILARYNPVISSKVISSDPVLKWVR